MSLRTLIQSGRIIISKPNFDASPALADENKVFDSDWPALGRLILSGLLLDTAAPVSGNVDRTNDANPRVIFFPFSFQNTPLVQTFQIQPSDYPGSMEASFTKSVNPVSVSTDRITIGRQLVSSGGNEYRRTHVSFSVFGV